MEPFQWLTEAESGALPPEKRARVEEGMADVLLYLVRLADKLDVELVQAARRKLEGNALKYPVEKSRGKSTKYTEL
jgi:dCTP diphosphatase